TLRPPANPPPAGGGLGSVLRCQGAQAIRGPVPAGPGQGPPGAPPTGGTPGPLRAGVTLRTLRSGVTLGTLGTGITRVALGTLNAGLTPAIQHVAGAVVIRAEERRVGKEVIVGIPADHARVNIRPRGACA